MKKLNKILILFFAFSFLTIYSGWRFIHSRKFSNEASIKITEILTKKFGTKLAFKGIDFGMFPPSTVFKNVHIEKKDPLLADIELDVEEVSIFFTYASFFSNNLEIDDLVITNGALTIVTPKTNTPDINWSELNIAKFYEEYSALLKKSPIHLNIAKLENVNLQINQTNLLIDTLLLAPHRKNVLLKLAASQLSIVHEIKNISNINLDKFEAFVDLNKDQWKVEKIHVEKDQNQIDSEALFFNKQKQLKAHTTTMFRLNMVNVISLFSKIPKEFLSIKGSVTGKIIGHGDLLDPDAEIHIETNQFKSEWIELENLKADILKKKSILSLKKLIAKNFNEKYELQKPQAVFDIKKEAFLQGRISLNLSNAFTNTFLFSLKSLENVKAYITGKVDVIWNGKKVFFEIIEKASVKDFKLLSSSEKPILHNEEFFLENTILNLDEKNKLEIDAKLTMNNTLIQAKGEITDNDINISIKNSKVDMKFFGAIAGLPITGSGPINAEIYGPIEDVKFDFIVDWNKFSIIDLNFGDVKSEFRLSLKKLTIEINKLAGIYNKSNFNAEGYLDFSETSGLDIKINFPKTNFNDARKMYYLAFKNINFPVYPEFDFSTNYRIHGDYNLEDLKIDGSIKGTDLKIYNEEADRIFLDFNLQNNILSFKDIKIHKSRGEIDAAVSVNLITNYTEIEGSSHGLRLRDLNFYKKLNMDYDGDLSIDFDGNGIKDNFTSRFKTKVYNPFIENIPASPSNAVIYLSTDEVAINANLLSDKIKIDSAINFKTRQASIKSSIETTDLREALGVFSGHNMSEKLLNGNIKAQLNSQFNIDTLIVNKLNLDFSKFTIKKSDINLRVDPTHNFVSINEGNVKSWDLRFFDNEYYLNSKAKNLSTGGIEFDQSFSIRADLLTFFSSAIDKAVGVIKGSNQIIVDSKVNIVKFDLSGIKNFVKIKNIPGAITGLDFNVIKKGNIFEVSHFTGKYGEGDFAASGNFVFDDIYPKVNIDYKIERSTIPILKRSSVLASSTGTITGTDLPYKLNGKISLLYGEFLDDPNSFTKENKVNLDSYKKYLPQKTEAEKKGYLNLNMSIDTVNPLLLKNTLAEVYIKASGQLTGDLLEPEINARLEIVPTVSRFKFKGHDFILNQGYVEIRDRGKYRMSDLKFTGLAKINDYEVKLDLSGSMDKTNINLSSEPPLAQEDLVSLLTLGVTSDMSKNLEASDRKSVTKVGIGALLVDQLKINEDLNSTLGLNLSVLPEFKEDDSSLISGKSAVNEAGSSKLKTATKIKVKKQINKLIDVSLSSTIGGSIEQTQEMNVNFFINKNFSLEGVYEVKPAEEENTTTPNSVGADLKYRRSF